MRSKSIVLILIAAVCGTVAATGVSQAIRSPGGGGAPAIETVKIFVAAKEIDIREIFNAENIRLEEWPKAKAPEGAIMNLEEIEGQYARTRLFSGEVILKQKLMGKDEVGAHEVTIPPGYRVKSVQVTMASAVSNLIMPGSRVDVLVFLKQGNGVEKTGAYTILKNVRVFAVNDKVDRDIDTEGQTIAAKTVSLLVKPDQVEKLLIASAVGRLELSLRRPDDESDDEGADMTSLSELLRGRAEFGVEKEQPRAAPVRPAAENFADFLRSGGATSKVAVTEVASAAFTMELLTPDGSKQYQWDDVNRLPNAGPTTSAPTPAATAPVFTGPGVIRSVESVGSPESEDDEDPSENKPE
jgi:pilus assembly protein CpaB